MKHSHSQINIAATDSMNQSLRLTGSLPRILGAVTQRAVINLFDEQRSKLKSVQQQS